MDYIDFTIRARDWRDGQFKVEVTGSPVDRMREPATVTYEEATLERPLHNLERKRIRLRHLIALGESLAGLLLPPTVRQMLLRSLEAIGPEQGLRLRLVLDDPQIANLPWEYTYLHRAAGEKGRDGFLVLDPRISMVRHEAIPIAAGSTKATRPLKLVVGLSSPTDAIPLNLEAERGFIKEALVDVDGIEAIFVEHLTADKLVAACQGAHIFHFAGHGRFAWAADEAQGSGLVVLEDETGSSHPFPAENLALTLRQAGVRLAVLGACETGRHDGVNVWSGVAPALMRAGIPAAVAMQYEIYDDSSVVFGRRLYEALAAGMSLDEAVAAGRLAAFNLGGQDDVEWGVPVLYMRSADGLVFPGVTADPSLEATRDQLRVTIRQRVEELRGKLLGAEVAGLPAGRIKVIQEITTLDEGGQAIGFRAGQVDSGSTETN